MNIKTVYHLNNRLSQESSWRKKELSQVKLLISSPDEDQYQQVLLRCAVVMLYAHWEGFIKKSSIAYLEFVTRQARRYADLTTNFIAVAMRAKINSVTDSKKIDSAIDLMEFMRTGLNETINMNWDGVINIEGNLNFEVFQNICSQIGIDYSAYETKKVAIDVMLLKN